ncbi:MAG: alanine dehydrogenase [Thermodesulfovibrionales bacterium]
MIIGVPKEIKRHEYRVGIIPSGVAELKKAGHTVLIESGAGEGSGFTDEEYLKEDADIVDRQTLFRKSDLIVKVKEPLPEEYDLIREGQLIFTYLHLAPNPQLTDLLIARKTTALGYETLEKDGTLPLLTPMSEIAGRMAPLMASYYLQKIHGGRGILSSGTVGVSPAKTIIIGAGVVGTNAARICLGLGMETVVLNRGIERLQRIDEVFQGRVKTLILNMDNLINEIKDADIVIGAILVPGGRTPVIIKREMLGLMKKGSVIVDVSVDQGGCVETTRPTTHDNPIYEVDGIIHYAVANMPGAYPRTATKALSNVTLPYIKAIATLGIKEAIRSDRSIRSAVNIFKGEVVHKALAKSTGRVFKEIDDLLN